MFHARVRDGGSNRVHGLGDFEEAEDAAEHCRDFLKNSNPPDGTESFVEAEDGEVVYTAAISENGNVSGSWKEEKASKTAERKREAEDKK